jgi:hypothetical protein
MQYISGYEYKQMFFGLMDYGYMWIFRGVGGLGVIRAEVKG